MLKADPESLLTSLFLNAGTWIEVLSEEIIKQYISLFFLRELRYIVYVTAFKELLE